MKQKYLVYDNELSNLFGKKVLLYFLALFFSLTTGSFNAQVSYTFTPCGASGSVGPSPTQVSNTYSSTNLNGMVTSTSGIQYWTVPTTGGYRIEARGAKGYGTNAGRGASVAGNFTLTAGQVIKIIVGQQGVLNANTSYSHQFGGGGGSFVTYTNNTALVVAGGGGGSWAQAYSSTATSNGTISTSGNPGLNGPTNGAGGSSGNGGTSGSNGDGGGGLTGNGGGTSGGFAFTNGGGGGSLRGVGGFGGGGGTSGFNNRRSGGGGGYSGGGGAGSTTSGYPEGGGGGSFNAGASATNIAGFNNGDGLVIISELCSINLIASGSNSLSPLICSGNSLTLTTNAVSGYSWSTGNTTSASIVVNPTVTTTYSVAGTSSASCNAAASIVVSVTPGIPNLSVTPNGTAVCPGQTAMFTATGATSYTWSGGITNGTPFTPGSSASYTVTGGNVCGTNSTAVSLTLNTTPTVGAVASTASLCSGSSATLTGTGANTYAWSGGITNGSGFFPGTTQTYTVTGTSPQGCTNTAIASITVVVTPSVAPVTSTPQICAGTATVTLTASGATGYTWTPGGFTTAAIAVAPGTTTTYTLVRDNGPCPFTSFVTVTVNAIPSVFAFASSTVTCAGETATLTGGGVTTYTWLPVIPTLTGQNVFVSPTTSTNYTVLGSNGTCTNVTTLSLQVNPNPTVTIAAATSTVLCRGQSATLTANSPTTNSSTATNYTWTVGNITGTNQIVVTPTVTTAYPIIVTNTFNCSSTATRVIAVNPLPTVVATAVLNRTLVCVNGQTTLSATGANIYSWTPGGTQSTNIVTVPATSIYTVTGTFSATGCKNTATIQINVFIPTVTITGPTATCFGGTVTLVGNGATTYTWNGTYPFQNFSASPTVATVYLVTGQTTSNNVTCSGTASTQITIFVNPTVSAVSQPSAICQGEMSALTGSGASTYEWSDNQSGTTVSVSPTGQKTYTVIGTDINGCKDTNTVLVKVSFCTGISELNGRSGDIIFVYPNPNNGDFVISSDMEMELKLFNELGQVIEKVTLTRSNNNHVSINNLSSGIYYLRGEKDGTAVNQKIIINK